MGNSFISRVVIVGSIFGFPNGQGATARVSQYADGLKSNGVDVVVLCLKPSDTPGQSKNNASGVYRGARYIYTSGSSIYATTKVGRYLQNVKGVFGAAAALRSIKGREGFDALLLYGTDSLVYTFLMWVFAKFCGVIFVGENTEAPFVYCKNGFTVSVKKFVCRHFIYKLFDGFVVISTYLERYFKRELGGRTPVLRLPILVNTDDFSEEKNPSKFRFPYVVYCGNLTNKGEIESVLDVWRRVSPDFPDVKLVVIGNNSAELRYKTIQDMVFSYGLSDRVVFTGLVERSELSTLLLNGCAMILPRASGTFSEAGLPNKLGEYLATGRPTVVTRNGDIDLYLEHGVSAFLVEPNDLLGFSEALSYLLSHESEAEQVGAKGRSVAIDCFSTHKNSKLLSEFISRLSFS